MKEYTFAEKKKRNELNREKKWGMMGKIERKGEKEGKGESIESVFWDGADGQSCKFNCGTDNCILETNSYIFSANFLLFGALFS